METSFWPFMVAKDWKRLMEMKEICPSNWQLKAKNDLMIGSILDRVNQRPPINLAPFSSWELGQWLLLKAVRKLTCCRLHSQLSTLWVFGASLTFFEPKATRSNGPWIEGGIHGPPYDTIIVSSVAETDPHFCRRAHLLRLNPIVERLNYWDWILL